MDGQQKLSAGIEANFNLKPARSQVFLVTLVIFASISLVIGAVFLWAGQNAGWAFVVLSALSSVGALWGWNNSHQNVDLDGSLPTTLTLPDGRAISADSRTLHDPAALSGLIRLVEEVLHRKPLPIADGLIDAKGVLLPNSAAQAAIEVCRINEETQRSTNVICDTLGISDANAPTYPMANSIGQPQGATVPPGINGPLADANSTQDAKGPTMSPSS